MGFSLRWLLPLWSTGSRFTGSVVVVHGLNCSSACGILPDQESHPCLLHWQAESLLQPPGKPQAFIKRQTRIFSCHQASSTFPIPAAFTKIPRSNFWSRGEGLFCPGEKLDLRIKFKLLFAIVGTQKIQSPVEHLELSIESSYWLYTAVCWAFTIFWTSTKCFTCITLFSPQEKLRR